MKFGNKDDKLVKNMSRSQQVFKQELARLVATISHKSQADRFLHDLLTPSEYQEIALRWQIVKLLNKGLTIREVAYRLGVAVATVERGARELKHSRQRGFHELLQKYA